MGSNEAMLSMTLASILLALQLSSRGPNLVVNSSFKADLSGWDAIWSREANVASAVIEQGRSDSRRAVVVRHTGTKDWSLAQQERIAVKPRQVYELSGWVKSEGGSGTLSVVLQNSSGVVVDWSFGAIQATGTGWQFVHRSVLVPKDAAKVQFRIIGSGPGITSVEAPSFQLAGVVPELKVQPVTLDSAKSHVTIFSDGAVELTAGKAWRFRPWGNEFVATSLKRVGPSDAEFTALDVSSGSSVVNRIHLDPKSGEVEVSTDAPDTSQMFGAFPSALESHPGDSLIVPMNEGLRLPVEDRTLDGWSLITYGGHGLCMPWTGLMDRSGAGVMTILETPDDADVVFQRTEGVLSFSPRWEISKGKIGYRRMLRLCTFQNGGYVSMAKRYRKYSMEHGLFKTLAQKRVENPNVDRLIGAVNVWNWDLDPLQTCKDLKQMGFDHVLWSRGGTAPQIREIAKMGYLPGRYDIFQDIWDPKHSLPWMPTEGWPDDLVLEENSDWMKGWAHPDKHPDGTITWYQGGVISSGRGLARAKRQIPADLAKIPYMARFIDTTTASPFREDYNPAHPLTRSQDRQNKMSLLEFCSKDMRQVVGTETGIDPSVPVVEYYEGMMSLGPFRLPDAGTFMME